MLSEIIVGLAYGFISSSVMIALVEVVKYKTDIHETKKFYKKLDRLAKLEERRNKYDR